MQLPGQLITDDGQRVGKVTTTGSAVLNQPDVVLRDATTGEEVDRTPRPRLTVQTVEVQWADGSVSTLTEHIDSWVSLGSIAAFPKIEADQPPPAGAFGELAEQQAVTDALDVGAYAAELRAAGPLAEARALAERELVVEDDGALTVAD